MRDIKDHRTPKEKLQAIIDHANTPPHEREAAQAKLDQLKAKIGYQEPEPTPPPPGPEPQEDWEPSEPEPGYPGANDPWTPGPQPEPEAPWTPEPEPPAHTPSTPPPDWVLWLMEKAGYLRTGAGFGISINARKLRQGVAILVGCALLGLVLSNALSHHSHHNAPSAASTPAAATAPAPAPAPAPSATVATPTTTPAVANTQPTQPTPTTTTPTTTPPTTIPAPVPATAAVFNKTVNPGAVPAPSADCNVQAITNSLNTGLADGDITEPQGERATVTRFGCITDGPTAYAKVVYADGIGGTHTEYLAWEGRGPVAYQGATLGYQGQPTDPDHIWLGASYDASSYPNDIATTLMGLPDADTDQLNAAVASVVAADPTSSS